MAKQKTTSTKKTDELQLYGVLFSFYMPMGAQVSIDAKSPEQAAEIAMKMLKLKHKDPEIVDVYVLGPTETPPHIMSAEEDETLN